MVLFWAADPEGISNVQKSLGLGQEEKARRVRRTDSTTFAQNSRAAVRIDSRKNKTKLILVCILNTDFIYTFCVLSFNLRSISLFFGNFNT
ncbi:hypothetical protein U1Q18_013309 [Sarracenia purpurea var. burkii]